MGSPAPIAMIAAAASLSARMLDPLSKPSLPRHNLIRIGRMLMKWHAGVAARQLESLTYRLTTTRGFGYQSAELHQGDQAAIGRAISNPPFSRPQGMRRAEKTERKLAVDPCGSEIYEFPACRCAVQYGEQSLGIF